MFSSDLCVFVSVLSRSQFLTDFDEIWYNRLKPEKKEPFRPVSKSNPECQKRVKGAWSGSHDLLLGGDMHFNERLLVDV